MPPSAQALRGACLAVIWSVWSIGDTCKRASAPVIPPRRYATTRRRESQSDLPLVIVITVGSGACLRAAGAAIGTGTAWCVLGGGVVGWEHRGDVHYRFDSAQSCEHVRPTDDRVSLK